MTQQLKLTADLVPESRWYKNMRSEFPKSVWDKIRKQQYAFQGHRCGICDAEERLNCHEVWEFDDTNRIQRLKGFIALCNLCHAVKHLGRTSTLDEVERMKVEQHFIKINKCDLRTFREHGQAAMARWMERSKYDWTFDLGEYQTLVRKRV
jgi:hypothetical protein